MINTPKLKLQSLLWSQLFLVSVDFFSRSGPSIFGRHDSPSNLADSRYPHSHQQPDRVKPWRRRRKLFRSKTVSCEVDRNTDTVNVRFFAARAGFQKRRNFSQRHALLINQNMHICPCSWAVGVCKNSDIGIQTYFGSVTAEYVEFYPLGVYFLYYTYKLHFLWRIFCAHYKSGNFGYQKVTKL